MSRILTKHIYFNSDTNVSMEGSKLFIKNKSNSAVIQIPEFISVFIEENFISLKKKQDITHPMFGTKRQEIYNTIFGFENGFSKTLKLFGVGYNVLDDDDLIKFSLGFSHAVVYKKNLLLKYEIISKDTFKISSSNKQLLGEEVSKIKRLRKRNVYDGYGIYDVDEPRILRQKRKK